MMVRSLEVLVSLSIRKVLVINMTSERVQCHIFESGQVKLFCLLFFVYVGVGRYAQVGMAKQ